MTNQTQSSTEPIDRREKSAHSSDAGSPGGWSGILAPGAAEPWPCNAIRRLLLLCFVIVLAGGAVLALPVSWHGHHPYEADLALTEQNGYALSTHGLNCLFMAVAAFTGTGLHVYEAGSDFSAFGQYALLALMELGGLLWLTLSTAAGWRLRAAMGWGAEGEKGSRRAMVRVVLVVLALALGLQLLGALAFHPAAREGLLSGEEETSAWFTAAFYSVSAWVNCGLTLRRNGLVGLSAGAWVYIILAGLMWLGSLGGPVLYEILRRPFRRTTSGGHGWSRFLKLTVIGSVAMVILGAGCVFLVESTTAAHWQLRYEAEGHPGHLATSSTSASPSTSDQESAEAGDSSGAIVFSSEDSDRAGRQRLQSLPTIQRLGSALFLSLQAGTGGMTPVRLDDDSIAPASRFILIAMMFVGGPLGGTAGGVRLMTVLVLAAALMGAMRGRTDERATGRWRCFAAGGVILLGMAILAACVTLVLVYRQPDSLERCLFDAISACSNVGLSTGMTTTLPYEDHTPGPLFLRLSGRLALILGMLLGRILPLAVILRMTQFQPPPARESGQG